MGKWEYLVGVQLNRPKETLEVSMGGREIIESHTSPEEWLNGKAEKVGNWW